MSVHCEGAMVPNEILTQVLSRLSTVDLLQNCRLVSRRWNQVVARVCRQRQLKFGSIANRNNIPICAMWIFKHPENVPWSAISLHTCSSLNADESGQVAERFGPTITSLQLTCSNGRVDQFESLLNKHFQAVLKILSSTPNLRKLEIFGISDQYLCSLVPSLLKTHLQQLTAEVTYTGVSLSWTQLANQRQFTLENQSLISIGSIPSVDYYRPLERFLDTCSGGLKSLKMTGFFNYQETALDEKSKLLKIPAFPNLRKLEIVLMNSGQNQDVAQVSYLHFEKLRAAQFPALDTVEFQMGEDWTEERLGVAEEGLTLLDVFGPVDNGTWATVRDLSIGDHVQDYGDWMGTFPNPTRLTATLWTRDNVDDIVPICVNVEELSPKMRIVEGSVDDTLFHAAQFFPAFTALKKLTIRNAAAVGGPLSDRGAIVLILLHPLDLTITNAQLSDNCVSLLRERHLRFDKNALRGEL